MSYNSNNLSVLAYANNFTLWHYKRSDEKRPIITVREADADRPVIAVPAQEPAFND